VTAGGALQHVLAEGFAGRSAFVIGAPAVHRHVEGAGLRIVNRSSFEGRAEVVVAAAHEGFDYAELRAATQSVLRGAALLGAGRDATGPMPDGPWPGTGAILAAIETATGATAQVVGKPAPQVFLTALDRLGVAWVPPPAAPEPDRRLADVGAAFARSPSPALVVGDRLDSDVRGAHAAGLDAALVLSGSTSRAGVDVWDGPQPVAVAPTLADLVLPAR
jgi:ribonucleotide monophosphatase NagD (HAD superfamily)